MKTLEKITSVFNIPQIQQETDYKKLYQKQKRTRIFYQRKAKQLQSKLTKYMKDNKHLFGRNKQQDIYNIMEEIKSFKGMLPNSVREIEIANSNHSIEEQNIFSLIKEFAIYGIKQSQAKESNTSEILEANTIFSSENVSQILQHTSKLVFPSGFQAQSYSGKQALDKSMEIMNISKEKLKSFILTFQPTSFDRRIMKPSMSQSESQFEKVINILNPQRRVYAVCIILEDFTVIDGDPQPFIKIENKLQKKKSQKVVKFKQPEMVKIKDLKIVVTQRAYTIFSYYPFFLFFEQLLTSLIYSAKVQRYIQYKESGENLRVVDSKSHCEMMGGKLEDLRNEANQKEIILDKLIDFTLGPNNKIYLELTQQNCERFLASDWAYSILSLFTLDVFLEVLTLMILEQKMVFVCKDKTILTYAAFLFTKVLIRPFQYPYPVVNLIPDQQEYLNAPFPIVYGYNKSKQEILQNKIPKKYKNVYVFFEPTGIQILTEESKRKILNSKSPKLRDKLLPKFKKMQKNFPKTSLTFLNFIAKKEICDFTYTTNNQLSKQIIDEVNSYMINDIFNLLPREEEIEKIRSSLVQEKIDEQEINQQIFNRIKLQYANKSRDPFFNAFLETQLLNVHIFKY